MFFAKRNLIKSMCKARNSKARMRTCNSFTASRHSKKHLSIAENHEHVFFRWFVWFECFKLPFRTMLKRRTHFEYIYSETLWRSSWSSVQLVNKGCNLLWWTAHNIRTDSFAVLTISNCNKWPNIYMHTVEVRTHTHTTNHDFPASNFPFNFP